MNNVIFIDDETDILESYKAIFNPPKTESKLKGLVEDFLGEQKEVDNDLFDEVKFDVHIADQGLSGVEIIKNAIKNGQHFKIAFIDMRMPPGINGLETAKLIRAIEPKIEIVIVTAYSDVDFKTISKELGAQDKLLYLKKPFDSQEIKQIALNLVAKSQNEQIKEDFISNVTHELNTPLSAIIGFYQLLAEKKFGEEEAEYINYIGMSANIMKSLVDELLMAVDIKRKGLDLIVEKVEMNEFVKDCHSMLKPIFLNKNDVAFRYLNETGDNKYYCKIDKLKIRQCVNNLVNNAYKFTQKGKVEIISKVENDNFIIAVCDSGMGIPEDKFNSIFEKFSRVETDHHQIPGLGLGLSIVKKIINVHGAKINVYSKLEEGSCFELIFKIGV